MRQKPTASRGNLTSNKDVKTSSSESSMVRTTSITSYVFRAPEPYKTGVLIIIISLLAGFFLNFDINNFDNNFSAGNIYINSIIFGLVLIGIPALLSGIISKPLADLLGGTFYFRRSFLLAFLSMVFLIIVLFMGKILASVYIFNYAVIIIFGYALIFGIRHMVILATSDYRNLNSLPGSINQTIFGYLFLWMFPIMGYSVGQKELLFMLLFTIIFFVITLLWLRTITGPFRRNFGVNGLMLMNHALTQFTADSQSGKVLEKEFFNKIGSNTNLRVGVVCFKKKNAAKQKPRKPPIETLLIVPSIHPGPFGILGGSNLPLKLSKYLKGVTTNLMVFHGPATHDLNPVATEECAKIGEKVRYLINGISYSDEVGLFKRGTLSKREQSTLNICSQRFGNGTVYIHTSSPESTDDIENAVGEAIISRAENETASRSLFIDAHNCLEPGTGGVFYGTEKANNMLKLVSRLNKESKNTPNFRLSSGYAADRGFKVSEGLGPFGIQVLIIQCEPIDLTLNKGLKVDNRIKKYAYVLLDGNNVVPGLRERILDTISNLVDDAEVFTTDNHIVNATMGGYNPVGLKINPKVIVGRVNSLVKRALRNVKPSEIGMNSGMVKNIRVLGQDTPMRLSTTVNSTISIMKSSLGPYQAFALALCWLVTLL